MIEKVAIFFFSLRRSLRFRNLEYFDTPRIDVNN